MPKVTASQSSKIKIWIKPYPELKSVAKTIFCSSCNKSIGSDRKSQVDAHCNSSGHTQLNAIQKSKRAPIQQLLIQSCSSLDKTETFFTDLCYAMVASDIPFSYCSPSPLSIFCKNIYNKIFLNERTLRKNYLKNCCEHSLEEIRTALN